ncbi:MAG TPA: NfeD family protein [Acidimicrobiia bacterium]
MRRLILAVVFLLIPMAGLAQDDQPGIDVIDVSGPLDRSALEFMRHSIQAAADRGQVLAVLQINSRAVLDQEALGDLLATIESPPLPLALWVGPAPAVAFGGAAVIVSEAEHAAVAPGSEVGLLLPVVAGEDNLASWLGDLPGLLDEPVPAEESGLDLQPSIRQYLQDLDGETFQTAAGPVVVETLVPFEEGVTLRTVTFRQLGLGTMFFRLAATPEPAFFFLVVGLTIVSFEFYAIGPGVAAGVAGVSLLLAGWGFLNLPVRPWALGLAVLGWAILTTAYQKGGVLSLTVLGAAVLQLSGIFYVAGSGQIDARWYLVLPSVLGVLFFFLLAMPTVQRARFSTQTIGREGLIGERGVTVAVFDPDGVVEVRGARWRATAHREAGLAPGSEVLVSGVDGLFLEVEPADVDREN